MWVEPLRARSFDVAERLRQVEVRDGAGELVLSVRIKYYVEHSTAGMGDMIQHRTDGSARQRVRAFALILRESIESMLALGITHGFAEAPWEMHPLVEVLVDRMTDVGGRAQWVGRLDDVHAKIMAKTAPDGSPRNITPRRIAELIDRLDGGVLGRQ